MCGTANKSRWGPRTFRAAWPRPGDGLARDLAPAADIEPLRRAGEERGAVASHIAQVHLVRPWVPVLQRERATMCGLYHCVLCTAGTLGLGAESRYQVHLVRPQVLVLWGQQICVAEKGVRNVSGNVHPPAQQ